MEKKRKEKIKKKEVKTIKIHRLQDQQVRDGYTEQIRKRIQEVEQEIPQMNIDEMWEKFKEIIFKVGTIACRVIITGGTKKKTRWWSEEIKNTIK